VKPAAATRCGGRGAKQRREVHPDAKFREAAEACEQRIEALNVDLAQDQALYAALSTIDGKAFDAITELLALQDAARVPPRRCRPRRRDPREGEALNEELVKLGQSFGRNIRDDVRTVKAKPADLDGVPKDWLDGHAPGADGLVSVTTNPPDYVPVMVYAKNVKVREELWRAYRNRAFPPNVEVLKTLLAKRHELATLLGYASWADYALETKMAKTGKAAAEFIEKGRAATESRAKADMAVLLKRKQKDVPGAKTLEPWEQDFYEDRVKNEQYGLDSQTLRTYFEYGTVKQGVMDITSRLFSVRYVKVTDAKVWHQDVETYDVYEGDALLGRFHLDMHPRENKYKHAAQFGLTTGRKGRELPEAVLVCNFPAGRAAAAQRRRDVLPRVRSSLHELFAGRQQWGGVSGIRTEWDFVEVPSMLLQEWPLDAGALAAFAKHHQTGAHSSRARRAAEGRQGVRRGPARCAGSSSSPPCRSGTTTARRASTPRPR
jgi:thimet oligopeptidase